MRALLGWVVPLLLVVATLPGCRTRPPLTGVAVRPVPPQIAQILDWEDRRALGGGQLVNLALADPDPAVRARAYLALARIQDPSTAPALVKGLRDPAPAARQLATFAAGQLGLAWEGPDEPARLALVNALLEAEPTETNSEIRAAQLEALSKLATPQALDRLANRLLGVAPEVQARAALGLGLAARRGTPLSAGALTSLAPLVRMANVPLPTRYGAAYALAMSKSLAARPTLLVCVGDDSGEVRALCARGLADAGLASDAVPLRLLLDDGDYRVAVEATRALVKLSERCTPQSCPALGALGALEARVERLERGDVAGGAQPLLTLAQLGLPAQGRSLLESIRGKLVAATARAAPARKQDLANLECRFAAALDGQRGAVEESLRCGGGLVPEARRVAQALLMIAQASPKDVPGRVDGVSRYLTHASPTVRNAALSLLAEGKNPAAVERVRPLLADADPIVAATAASALGELKDVASGPQILRLTSHVPAKPDLAEAIATALAALKVKDAEPVLRRWLESPEPSVSLVAARALKELTGTQPRLPRPERSPERARATPPPAAQVVLRTEKGSFTVALYTQDAPRTAASFYALAKEGYFNNLTFHRVVPDFVVQGGDPRGDGEGGPGYRVRCEVNPRPYGRRTVGMALSGKDTGGSQFFVTLSPQPHLDGRYTVFGEVTAGEEVLDALLEGDRILEAKVRL